MKHAALALLLSTSPAWAQDGTSLIEEGAKLFFQGILEEMDPALDQLRDYADQIEPAMQAFADRMGPALIKLLAFVDDIGNYDMPEFMPNGDIIIRRSPDAPPFTPPVAEPVITDL
jgi:hypothetical protein